MTEHKYIKTLPHCLMYCSTYQLRIIEMKITRYTYLERISRDIIIWEIERVMRTCTRSTRELSHTSTCTRPTIPEYKLWMLE